MFQPTLFTCPFTKAVDKRWKALLRKRAAAAADIASIDDELAELAAAVKQYAATGVVADIMQPDGHQAVAKTIARDTAAERAVVRQLDTHRVAELHELLEGSGFEVVGSKRGQDGRLHIDVADTRNVLESRESFLVRYQARWDTAMSVLMDLYNSGGIVAVGWREQARAVRGPPG